MTKADITQQAQKLTQQAQKQFAEFKLWWANLPLRTRKVSVAVSGAVLVLFLALSFTGSNETRSIEQALAQDSRTSDNAQTVAEVVVRMRAIDLSHCPNDFKSAYLAHIHAWESVAQAQQKAAAFEANNPAGGVLIESFIRGFLGDPMGKANEMNAGQSELRRRFQAASDEVKATFNHVEEVAVAHGAKLPQKQ